MKPTQFRVFGSLVVLSIFLAGVWASTQAVAKWLAYQPQLGAPWFVVQGLPIYNPLSFLKWCFQFGAYAPKQFERAMIFSFLGSLAGVGTAIFLALRGAKKAKEVKSHGSAAWARREDLKKAKLLEGKGVVLGVSKEGDYLRHDGPEHVMVMAPTRTGKGVGIIIPTLLTWPHSVVVTDIKGENWGITAGYRKRALGNKVLKFDPTAADGSGVRFNPLKEIRLGTLQEVKDTQNVADILVDPQGTGQQDHWAKTGHALLVGTILHILYSRTIKQKNLTAVASFLSDPSRNIDETLIAMMNEEHDPELKSKWVDMQGRPTKTHPVVAAAARELLNKSENERSGVLSTAMSFLGLYRDPIVSANTSESDFHITDLMNHDHPVSLYLVVPPSDLSRTRPLMRMIINQIGRTLTESMEFKEGKPVVAYRHRLLLLLDEFPALGRLDFFESALAFIAGYGMKALLIIQSLNQLRKAYGPNNSILDNCHIRTVYTPNDNETAELISRMLGQKTELVQNQSYSGNRLNPWLKNMSYSTQQIGRALMTAGEVSVLPHDEEIVFVAGTPPILAKKLFYYQDENFTSRLLGAPPKSDICRQTPIAAAEVASAAPLQPVASLAAVGAGIAFNIETPGLEKAPKPEPGGDPPMGELQEERTDLDESQEDPRQRQEGLEEEDSGQALFEDGSEKTEDETDDGTWGISL